MRVLCRCDDSMTTSPPRPPSPPDGPPRGTNFSRRNAIQPLPPSPAFTRIFASSMNIETRIQWKGKISIRDREPGTTARPRLLTPSLQSTESKRLDPNTQQLLRKCSTRTVTHGTFRAAVVSLESLAIHLGILWISEIALNT